MTYRPVDFSVFDRFVPPEPKVICDECEGSGWTAYGLGFNDPHFRECQSCGNPEELSSP